MTKVYIQNNTIINVGDWDYKIQDQEEVTNPFLEEGEPPEEWDFGIVIRQIVHNPLPEDAVESDIDIYYADDGSIRKESDRIQHDIHMQVGLAKKELEDLMIDIRLDMATDEDVLRAKSLREFIKNNE